METVWLSATELRTGIATGALTARDVTEALLDRIGKKGRDLGCYLTIDAEGALAQAAMVDRTRARNENLGPLAGVPVALKDNLCTRGLRTTCGSRMLERYDPPYDAHVVERLRAAGAVVIGKTNMDEFAMGSSNENSAFGLVRNPWNTDRVPGGSSGGSAAAVAAGLTTLALGSDTGGSVRQPGAFCGLSAIKPTYGRVSRYGLVAFASSLDQVGTFGRSVRDAALLLGVIAGHDRRDATSASSPSEPFEEHCGKPVHDVRVGVVRRSLEGADSAVVDAITHATAVLKSLGCSIVDIEMPHFEHAVAVYYVIATAEASSNLARFDGVRYGLRVGGSDLRDMYEKTRGAGFGREVKRRIMLGTYALSAGYYDAYYGRAQRVRTLIAKDYDDAWRHCHVVLTPTTPTPAFALGEKMSDPLSMYLADVYTLPPSLAGLPAMSVPCGFTWDDLPLGLQLTSPAFEEGRLIALADAFERNAGHFGRHPRGFES